MRKLTATGKPWKQVNEIDELIADLYKTADAICNKSKRDEQNQKQDYKG